MASRFLVLMFVSFVVACLAPQPQRNELPANEALRIDITRDLLRLDSPPQYQLHHQGNFPLRMVNRSGGRISVHIRPVSARPFSFTRERASGIPQMMSLDHAAQLDWSWGQPWGTIEPEQNATFLLEQGVYDVRVTGVMMLMPGYSEVWFKATAPNPDPQGLDIEVPGPTQVLWISDRSSQLKDKPKDATFLELVPVDALPRPR